MNWFGAGARACAATAVAAAIACSSGCTSTVGGLAVRDPDAAPIDVPPLKASQLKDVLLSVAQLNQIAGATKMASVIDSDQMSDNSSAVSDPDCLGTIFGGEQQVYQSSGWTAMHDQVAHEPGGANDHWVEQTLVLYPSEQRAKEFVDHSRETWTDCGGFSVAVEDQSTSSIWRIGDVGAVGAVETQNVSQEDSNGWECQHALTSVANLTVEAVACAFGISDQAVTMVDELVENASRK